MRARACSRSQDCQDTSNGFPKYTQNEVGTTEPPFQLGHTKLLYLHSTGLYLENLRQWSGVQKGKSHFETTVM